MSFSLSRREAVKGMMVAGAAIAAAGGDEESTMLVLRWLDATKYSRPMKCSIEVGMHGLYVNAEVSARIYRENQ